MAFFPILTDTLKLVRGIARYDRFRGKMAYGMGEVLMLNPCRQMAICQSRSDYQNLTGIIDMPPEA